ncbi:unnamed protein product [Linum tenue]|uniref:Uncharacterized protein n=1 Tax=Linum tenue TaxID=586396 RepID=A0AAV0JMT6_9ROSI|nr:unnamed protein product [Linum tenue]
MVRHKESYSYSYSGKNSQAQDYNPKEVEDDVGQGKLYSPAAAINHSRDAPKQGKKEEQEERKMRTIMEKVLEKLGAASSVPKQAIDNFRQFLDSMVKEASVAAHGITMKDGLDRIKNCLLDILPSSLASKLVDDAEKEANDEDDAATAVESGRRGDEKASGTSNNGSRQSSPSSRL